MEITASLVKELRERTGAGMMECKKALTEAGGNIDAGVLAQLLSEIRPSPPRKPRRRAREREPLARETGQAAAVATKAVMPQPPAPVTIMQAPASAPRPITEEEYIW